MMSHNLMKCHAKCHNFICHGKSKNVMKNVTKPFNRVDQMVYKLYGLSEEGIKIVEGGK